MQEFQSRQIGDFLHFLKNARTRIDQKIVHCDCNPEGPGTSVMELSGIFAATRFLTDFRLIGRMRENYPLPLFVLQSAFFANTNNGPDSFLYLLIYAIWEESLLRQELSMSMRLFMLQVVSYFMSEMHFAIHQLKEQRTLRVTEKKTAHSSHVTVATFSKLKRMILTVLGQISAINFFPRRPGLDRLGSHVEENSIRIIRQRCCSNNQAETVFRAVARLECIKSRLPALGYQPQLSSRANLGGVRIADDGMSTQPAEVSPIQIVHSILCGLGHEIRQADAGIVPFEQAIQWILDLAVSPPPGSGHFCGDASGSQILARLIAFRSERSLREKEQAPSSAEVRRTRTWTVDDLERLKEAMKEGERDFSKLGAQFPNKSVKCIQKKYRELLRFESSRRPWTFNKDHRLLEWVAKCGRRWRQAEAEFKWRSEGLLRQCLTFCSPSAVGRHTYHSNKKNLVQIVSETS
jgi:hypothetical protein